jgi:hypothetical protein
MENKFNEEKEYVTQLIYRELGQVKTNVQAVTERHLREAG